jgi:two-component system CheB/CheR fusion protein
VLETQLRTPSPSRATSPSSRPRRLRIFVVENHEDTRVLLCILLEQMGHTVRTAATMDEALREIPRSDCDVLISDIGLPDGDGWELMRRLERRPRYAIAMSGLGMNGDRARSREVGFRHHLVKPTGPEQLAEILQSAAHELRREVESAS